MIIDRYVRPANVCTSGIRDPILNEFDWMLEDAELFRLVRKDLAKHYKHTKRGRRSVGVEVVLRLIVLRRLKRWSIGRWSKKCVTIPAIGYGHGSMIHGYLTTRL